MSDREVTYAQATVTEPLLINGHLPYVDTN